MFGACVYATCSHQPQAKPASLDSRAYTGAARPAKRTATAQRLRELTTLAAKLGINMSQAMRIDAAPVAIVPSRAGAQVQLAAQVSAPLRVQVAAADGTTNLRARWCAAVSGRDSFVPWTAFNTACWDGSGEPYRNEPISVAMLLVPGNAQTAVDYDVCLRRIAEADESH
jgi:hypothetical protein